MPENDNPLVITETSMRGVSSGDCDPLLPRSTTPDVDLVREISWMTFGAAATGIQGIGCEFGQKERS